MNIEQAEVKTEAKNRIRARAANSRPSDLGCIGSVTLDAVGRRREGVIVVVRQATKRTEGRSR
jgi:hypothetical protein